MPGFTPSVMTTTAYPRTGKRGVPQQFPRRLYEMLEHEARLAETNSDHQTIIFWSKNGTAFRIVDVTLFASKILPRYFRTSKFSSFQRNLNLYGFSKVKRGPETDMYSHPSFVQGRPENLSQLRKVNSTASRRKEETNTRNQNQEQHLTIGANQHLSHGDVPHATPAPSTYDGMLHYSHVVPVSSRFVPGQRSAPGHHDTTGKLGLLTMAMTMENYNMQKA
eukprot:CAMPEP_0202446352 /NCGR_PEP_ID=MMETSP1360-20130828/4864_1 /ASSEMBLY_ACC=CAM_ASM_000848 /TAXON_ID=515479 /ORGANISM="Licmophora paradoxa, Strain CCMP2313" /LENGTH=220 /DNA_ID=CAMNT_0049062799 /DNA_START=38 /DNA_END=700 /DNA_ORIENTATION=-